MRLDWTISIGNVLTALVLVAGFFAAHIQNIRRLERIETRVGMMYSWFLRRVVHGQQSEQEEREM